VISRVEDRLQVSGRLTMETVTAFFDAGLEPDAKGELVVDMSRVEAVDSAAVSLLLSWLRRAQRSNVVLRVAHAPESLLSLADLYGVAEFLPMHKDASSQP
jgi:phospholipid transport system transporter-binding protein